jgi:hypothetical protein
MKYFKNPLPRLLERGFLFYIKEDFSLKKRLGIADTFLNFLLSWE